MKILKAARLKNNLSSTMQPLCERDISDYFKYLRITIPDAWRNLNTPKDRYEKMSYEQFVDLAKSHIACDNIAIVSMKLDGVIVGIARITRNVRTTQKHCGLLGMTVHPKFKGISVGDYLLQAIVL